MYKSQVLCLLTIALFVANEKWLAKTSASPVAKSNVDETFCEKEGLKCAGVLFTAEDDWKSKVTCNTAYRRASRDCLGALENTTACAYSAKVEAQMVRLDQIDYRCEAFLYIGNCIGPKVDDCLKDFSQAVNHCSKFGQTLTCLESMKKKCETQERRTFVDIFINFINGVCGGR